MIPASRLRDAWRGRGDSRHLLAALLDSVTVAALACAADCRLTHANAPARELIGADCAIGTYPETWMRELRPRTASGIAMPREDLPPLRALAGEAVRGVDVLVCARGQDVLLEVRARPARDAKGRPRGAIVLLEDVTEQRRYESVLRERLRAGSRTPLRERRL